MAALKWVYVIVLIVLMFELGSSLRVINDRDKGTYKPDDLGFPAGTWTSGDLPSINVGPGGVFLGFGNGQGGSIAGSGSANINIGPGGIWIPGLPIPGLVTGQGEGGGCSCDSCRTDGRPTFPHESYLSGGSRGCTDTDCGSPISRSIRGNNDGIFGSHGGNPLTPLTPSTPPVRGTIIPGTPVGYDSQNNRADDPTKVAAGHD